MYTASAVLPYATGGFGQDVGLIACQRPVYPRGDRADAVERAQGEQHSQVTHNGATVKKPIRMVRPIWVEFTCSVFMSFSNRFLAAGSACGGQQPPRFGALFDGAPQGARHAQLHIHFRHA